MKGVKEMKALLDILELDSSVYVRIQVKSVCWKLSSQKEEFSLAQYALECTTRRPKYAPLSFFLINTRPCLEKGSYWLQHLKSLLNLHADIFGFLGVIKKEKLAFKNCKISGWQKR